MTDLTLLAAKEVLALDPECYRAHDTMCAVGGVSNLHQATTIGYRVLAQTLPEKLQALDSIPKAVREYFDDPKGGEMVLYRCTPRGGSARRRLAASRRGPHWAGLIRETRFVQVCRRLQFLRGPLGMSAAEFWAESAAGGRDPSLSALPGIPRSPAP